MAPQIAGFLVALHSFPVDWRFQSRTIRSWLEDFREMHEFLLAELESRLTSTE